MHCLLGQHALAKGIFCGLYGEVHFSSHFHVCLIIYIFLTYNKNYHLNCWNFLSTNDQKPLIFGPIIYVNVVKVSINKCVTHTDSGHPDQSGVFGGMVPVAWNFCNSPVLIDCINDCFRFGRPQPGAANANIK